MKFTTKIEIPNNSSSINYHSRIVSLGSCFAENMGHQLAYHKFQSHTNPFGIIFNPVSIANIISRGVQKEYFTEETIFFHNEIWQCYEVHSQLSNANKTAFLDALNQLVDTTFEQLKNATHVIITLGTAWAYRHIATNTVVANCHKVPQQQFAKELLPVAIIKENIENSIRLIQSINSNATFIFTISPVRHIKDGFVENQVSKAHLITAVYQVVTASKIGNPQAVNYFPSYEIMMDELRDYRFYAEDMLHPSPTAIAYIWEQLVETHFDQETTETMALVQSIQKGLSHRPLNPSSESHQKFIVNLNLKMNTLVKKYPFITF